MQLLSHGGEFITHLWDLLYHIGIDGWEWEPEPAAGESEVDAGETSEQVALASAPAPAELTKEAVHVEMN